MDGSGQILPWGVERIGGPESAARSGDGQGQLEGVDFFLLDSGTRSYDIRIGQRFTNFSDSPTPEDVFAHGVHLSSTAVAQDNNKGFVGVAPGARIHSVKVLGDNGETDMSVVVAALDSVVALKNSVPNRNIVVNMSFGADVGTTEYTALDEAVDAAVDAGITVVVAAGNDGIDASTITPAHAAGAITVGAYDVYNRFADFSNYGPAVDLMAPGVDILSIGLDENSDIIRAQMSGTSMAASHVSGAALLYLAHNPGASPSDVRNALMDASKATVWNMPDGTTDRTVWVGDNFPLEPAPQQTVRDEFNAISFSGNDGSATWAGDWEELGENDGPGAGFVEVRAIPDNLGQGLRIKDDYEGVQREVDLSGATSATFRFDYLRRSLSNSSEYVGVWISDDGGATWTELARLEGPADDAEMLSMSFDISEYISSETMISFYSSSGMNEFDYVYIDNVEIEF